MDNKIIKARTPMILWSVLPAKGKGKGRGKGRKSSKKPNLSLLISSEEKLVYLYHEIARFNCDPAVLLDLPWGLLVMRLNSNPSYHEIRRLSYRIGATVFGTPSSEKAAYRILYAYRFYSRVDEHKTFSDIKAAGAAELLGEVAGKRFQQLIKRDDEGEMEPMIAAISYVFEISGNAPYSRIFFEVQPNGQVEIAEPGLYWPPLPVPLVEHADTISKRFAEVTTEVMDKIEFIAKFEPRQHEMHLVWPFVAAISKLLLEEHALKMKSKVAGYRLPLVETVYLSANSIRKAHEQEAEGLYGDWEKVWNPIGPEALVFYEDWLKKVNDLKAKSAPPSA